MSTGTSVYPGMPPGDKNGLEAIADEALKAESDTRFLAIVSLGVRDIKTMIDAEHSQTAKFKIIAIEPVTDADRERVFKIMQKVYARRTGKRQLDLRDEGDVVEPVDIDDD